MANDLVALVKEKKAQIASLQAELQALRAELDAEPTAVTHRAREQERAVDGKHRGRPRKGTTKRRRRTKESSTGWTEQVLATNGQPTSVKEILRGIKERFHQDVKETTLVGNLSRKVKAHDTFYRAGPSVYGLLEWKTKQTKAG